MCCAILIEYFIFTHGQTGNHRVFGPSTIQRSLIITECACQPLRVLKVKVKPLVSLHTVRQKVVRM